MIIGEKREAKVLKIAMDLFTLMGPVKKRNTVFFFKLHGIRLLWLHGCTSEIWILILEERQGEGRTISAAGLDLRVHAWHLKSNAVWWFGILFVSRDVTSARKKATLSKDQSEDSQTGEPTSLIADFNCRRLKEMIASRKTGYATIRNTCMEETSSLWSYAANSDWNYFHRPRIFGI